MDLAAIENKMLFLPKENIEAMKWLRKNSKENEVILSSPYWNGNFIPGVAVRPVYAGHGVETAFFETKENEINWFFNDNQSNEDEKKRNFLKRADISYVFWRNEEKELGNLQPKEKNYLQLIYENEKVSIFKDISD